LVGRRRQRKKKWRIESGELRKVFSFGKAIRASPLFFLNAPFQLSKAGRLFVVRNQQDTLWKNMLAKRAQVLG
jgi:hypothetical protein